MHIWQGYLLENLKESLKKNNPHTTQKSKQTSGTTKQGHKEQGQLYES